MSPKSTFNERPFFSRSAQICGFHRQQIQNSVPLFFVEAGLRPPFLKFVLKQKPTFNVLFFWGLQKFAVFIGSKSWLALNEIVFLTRFFSSSASEASLFPILTNTDKSQMNGDKYGLKIQFLRASAATQINATLLPQFIEAFCFQKLSYHHLLTPFPS